MDLPIEALYDVTRVADVAVSPDGSRVAFVASEMDPDADERRSSVFVAPTDGSRDPHRLTRVDDAAEPVWSPDGSRLAVIMAREEDVALRVGRQDGADEDGEEGEEADDSDGEADDSDEDEADTENGGDGDDEPKPQVWVYDLDLGGDARQVTRFDEGAEAFDWSPDGDRLVVAARDPTEEQREYLDDLEEGGPVVTERLQHKFDGAGYLDTVRTYLHVVDAETRETERLDSTGLPPSAATAMIGREPAWGERGIAFCGYDGTDDEDGDDTYVHDVFVCDPSTDERERVTDGSLTCERLAWSPSGDRLAFAGGDPENWYTPTEVYVAEPETGSFYSVSEDLDRTLGYYPVRWLDDDALVAPVADEGWTRLARFHADPDSDGGAERVYGRQSRSESIVGFDAAGERVALVISSPEDGTDVYALPTDALDADGDGEGDESDGPDAARARLTALNDDLLAEYGGLRSRRVSFTGGDDDEVEAIAYYPEGFDSDDPDPRPFVLAVHGGPMAYDQPMWSFEDLLFTDRGYVVLRVNYHGSTSYGRAFCESLKGAWNGLEVDDLLAATDWAVESGWADPDRLFVTGFSQGGVNTGYLVTRTDRFAAGAAEHGIYDLRSSFGTDDSHNWLEADFGVPWENVDAYEGSSSLPDVGEVSTPLLLTAGEEDWRCPPSQSEQFYVSLKKQGVPAKLVVYRDEHHAVTDPERSTHRLRTILDWFDEHSESN